MQKEKKMAKSYLGTPQDFGKVGQFQALREIPWAKITTYYYQVQQFQFPLTPAEFDGNFGGTIRLFSLVDNQPCPGMQTNAAVGSSVNEPFVALGTCIIATGESKSFTLTGQFIDRNAINCPPCPPAAGTTGAVCPPVGPCADGTFPSAENAAVFWGGSTWQFIANFFQAYRLQIAINRRFLVVDEALMDVGMCGTPACFEGFGDSLVPAMPYVREVNDILAAKGCGKVFLPQNVAAGSLCVGAPTAAAAYGCVKVMGLANRMYCFNYPLVFLPGMSFDISLVRVENDCCFLPAMRRNSVVDCGGPCPTADAILPPGCGCAWTIPGGCLSIGLALKGYALQPAACLQFLADYCLPGSPLEALYVGNSYVGGLVANPAIRANLAGTPDQNLNRFLGQPKT